MASVHDNAPRTSSSSSSSSSSTRGKSSSSSVERSSADGEDKPPFVRATRWFASSLASRIAAAASLQLQQHLFERPVRLPSKGESPRRARASAAAAVAGAVVPVALLLVLSVCLHWSAYSGVWLPLGRLASSAAAAGGRESAKQAKRLEGLIKAYSSRPLPGCILYVDDRRITAWHVRIPATDKETMADSSDASSNDTGSSAPASHNYMEENGEAIPYWVASKIINRSYASRHGYRFAAMDPSKYKQDRHASWFKILFLRDQLSCCCQWALCVDSDAYLRFNNHQMSVEAWLAQVNMEGYFDWITSDYGAGLVNQTHFPRDPSSLLMPADAAGADSAAAAAGDDKDALFALFPRNVDDRYAQYPHARPEALFSPDLEYINAGVSLWRRSAAALQALDVWYMEPEESPQLWEHPWEQLRLSRLAAHYRTNVAVVPFLELTGPDGRMVRHFWKGMTNREEMLRLALLGSVVAHAV